MRKRRRVGRGGVDSRGGERREGVEGKERVRGGVSPLTQIPGSAPEITGLTLRHMDEQRLC